MRTLGSFSGMSEGRLYLDACGCCMWSRELKDLKPEEITEVEQELEGYLKEIRALRPAAHSETDPSTGKEPT